MTYFVFLSLDRIGDYDCSCQPEWKGKNCDVKDMASPGGIDKTNGRFEIVNIYEEKQKCVESYTAVRWSSIDFTIHYQRLGNILIS